MSKSTTPIKYFSVGPSQLYPSVNKHINEIISKDILSVSHTGDFFTNLYKSLINNLREIFDLPESHQIFFTGSSTESMHTAIYSTVDKHCAHIITGGFSEKFYKAALDLGKKAEPIYFNGQDSFNINQLNLSSDTELLAITENETSLGIQIPIDDLVDIKTKHPDMLIAVDIVSSAPYCKIDFKNIDIAFFSVHKGLGLPAGLGILIASPRAIKKSLDLKNKGRIVGGHHSLVTLNEKAQTHKTPETPNVFNIFLLERVTADLISYGIDKMRSEINEKAHLIYGYFDHHPNFKPVINGIYRSKTTPVINVNGKAKEIAKKLASVGFVVSTGYKPHESDYIRIANFPAHSVNDVKNLLLEFDKLT